jgi:hypothetical protein
LTIWEVEGHPAWALEVLVALTPWQREQQD